MELEGHKNHRVLVFYVVTDSGYFTGFFLWLPVAAPWSPTLTAGLIFCEGGENLLYKLLKVLKCFPVGWLGLCSNHVSRPGLEEWNLALAVGLPSLTQPWSQREVFALAEGRGAAKEAGTPSPLWQQGSRA